VWLIAVCLFACRAPKTTVAPSQTPPAVGQQCSGDGSLPSVSESRTLPTGTAGGPNAWFEARVTWGAPVPTDYRLLLDGVDVPVVRVKSTKPAGNVIDPSEGHLQGTHVRSKAASNGYHDTLSFRIPPGTPPGRHQLIVKSCDAVAPETITIDVLPSPAPVITAIHSVRGEVWPVLFIDGSNLSDAEEVILVAEDEAISSIPNVTSIDNEHIRATIERSGRYEVFVRTKSGLGGGPPGGVITVR
jgi:hypothetical protein